MIQRKTLTKNQCACTGLVSEIPHENFVWRFKLNIELHNLFASLNTILVIKSRGMRWTEYIARMEEMRNAHKILVRKLLGKKTTL